ncbi:MAG: ArsB/NhaD family transporter [Victivallales bacterium]|jgi:Na+/H+ antiporter NhaD/arsenite permease-like protein|nr:ArsB/NhaD family transporter [Victivallales bacterium]
MEYSALMFWIGTIVFVGTYVLIASEKVHKTVAALLGAMLMLIVILPGPGHSTSSHEIVQTENLGSTQEQLEQNRTETLAHAEQATPEATGQETMLRKAELYDKLDTFARYSNFDVVFTLAGMMLLVNLLSGTGLFQFVAIRCAKIAKGLPIRTMILLVFATAILSAFLDNVTTILLVAPVTLLVCNELGVPPIPFLMAETMASNIGGTATLIGDPPNLIIGSIAGLNFADFLINLAPFIVVVMIIYCICLWAHYSKRMKVTVEKRALIMELDERAAITDWSNLKRGGVVMILTIIGFLIHGAVGLQPCVVAMAGSTLALCICKVDVDHALEKIEWSTLFFFMALFILVCGAEFCGLMAKIGGLMSLMNGWSVPVVILVIMWVSAIAAAVMNNVSFTAAMVTVIAAFISSTPAFGTNEACRDLLWWGLALAVCLGGNASLVGAAANLVTVGIAEKNGHNVTFSDFLRYGIPVTLGSMVLASGYILARYFILCV